MRTLLSPGTAALLLLVGVSLCLPADAMAHGGGLDASGGHNDRKRGTYHCHRCPCGCAAPKVKAPPNPQDSVSRSEVEEIQGLLKTLEYVYAKPNGVMSDVLAAAIKSYQEDQGLKVDGQPSKALLRHLRKTVAAKQATAAP